MESVLTPLAKSALVPLSFIKNIYTYSKETFWIMQDYTNNPKQRIG